LNLELIKVSNGTKEYPGNFTKQEIYIIKENIKGLTLHLFSGKSDIGNLRIDYTYSNECNCTMNVFDYLDDIEHIKDDCFKTIIIDAPYNQKFANKYQKIGNTPKQFIIFANTKDTTILFNKVIEINPEIIILKSWNYYIVKGYKLKKGYICYPGGYRKSTLLIIMEKITGE